VSSRDVYIAIMVASARDKGLHLTPEECDELSLDEAVHTRAFNGLTLSEADAVELDGDQAWARLNPDKPRVSANAGTTEFAARKARP